MEPYLMGSSLRMHCLASCKEQTPPGTMQEEQAPPAGTMADFSDANLAAKVTALGLGRPLAWRIAALDALGSVSVLVQRDFFAVRGDADAVAYISAMHDEAAHDDGR